ncbi:MAG: hypothetical protein M3Z01_08525 [Thermoproteota archaeon]|nr:hypothetical protein [Thermoproteota archaeon]
MAGFRFDLDQNNIYYKHIERFNIEYNKASVPIPQRICNIIERLKTPEEVEQYFPGFWSFMDSIE